MSISVLDSLNRALLTSLEKDERVILVGEDILDPYGGAFKVTRGCSSAFSDRVVAAPISEAGLAGIASGMALRGLRPVVEIMFGDFTLLMADQIINHMSKFRWMYNNTVSLPVVIRTPMGGRRGYGPTHSQTLEKHFLGVPGLMVVAPVNFDVTGKNTTPGALLEATILHSQEPVLFIENKLQYLLPVYTEAEQPDLELKVFDSPTDEGVDYPNIRLRIKGAPKASVTLTAYGYMVDLVRQAMVKLAYEEEIFTELIIPTCLSPFKVHTILESALTTGRLVTIEEGPGTMGWGAEVITRVVEAAPGSVLKAARIAALDLPVPAAPGLESVVLPQLDDILQGIRKMVRQV